MNTPKKKHNCCETLSTSILLTHEKTVTTKKQHLSIARVTDTVSQKCLPMANYIHIIRGLGKLKATPKEICSFKRKYFHFSNTS